MRGRVWVLQCSMHFSPFVQITFAHTISTYQHTPSTYANLKNHKASAIANWVLLGFQLWTIPESVLSSSFLKENESPITNPHEIKKSATVFDLSKFLKCQVLPIWRNHVHPFQILTPLGSPFTQIDVIPVHLSLIDRCTQSDRRSSAPFGKSSGIVQRPK